MGARNACYLFVALAATSLLRWVRDPVHKYFVFIQDRRTRTMVHQYKYREEVLPGKGQGKGHGAATTPLANQSRSLLGPVSILRQSSIGNRTEHEEVGMDVHVRHVEQQ